MQASRGCGEEVSSFTPIRAVKRTQASWRIPKGSRFESGSRVPPVPKPSPDAPSRAPEQPAVHPPARRAEKPPTKGGPGSDQGTRLAAVNGHTSAADPARARRREERDDRPDFFGAAERPERQLPPDEFCDAGRILLLPAVPRSPLEQNRSRRHAVDANVVDASCCASDLARLISAALTALYVIRPPDSRP